jgi:serine/threonine protein kinase
VHGGHADPFRSPSHPLDWRHPPRRTPKNILWFPGGVFKLADFGISKAVVEADELARTLVGHKTFIPPELLASGYSSYQSDIYQLGLVLLALLTGDYPIPLDSIGGGDAPTDLGRRP